jgi:hypothetical protein
MNPLQYSCLIPSAFLALLIALSGCEKKAPAAAPSATRAVEDPKELRIAALYAQYEKALRVELTPQEIAGLPARAAESARRRGEIRDLELLSAPGGNADVVRKVAKTMVQQLGVFYEHLGKEPLEIQGMFRMLLAGGGLRNPVFLDNHRVAFETDGNVFDSADRDLYSDIYFWDFASGNVKCKSVGPGVDGDWACRESSVAAQGDAFVFERQFMGESGKAPADAFAGIAWLATASLVPLSTAENWVPDLGFVPLKTGDRRFFRRPVISGDANRVALVSYFAPTENDRRDYGDTATYELVLVDRETKKCRSLSARVPSMGRMALSRDGKFIAVVAPPVAFEKGNPDTKPALYRVPGDGSKPKRIALPPGLIPDQSDGAVPAISADGSRIAFAAAANTGMQIYFYDDAQGSVTLLSVTPSGIPAKGNSSQPAMNAEGTTIAFATEANDVVPSGSRSQICVRKLGQAQTVIGSVTANGQPCHGVCRSPSLSSDGALLTFLSTAEDLPGVRKVKSQPPGLLPSRLFVTRLADRQYAILGGTLNP